MRNIKITALLLAVLMVVSAFAGCASSSDLENKVNEQANAIAGIQDSIKDLADAIANQGSSSELDDIKADIAENKQDAAENKQNIADILEAINGLKDAVAGATGESEDVKTAINQAGAKIDALKEAYTDNKMHYTAEDWATITATLGAAQAAISTCVTAEAVAAELAAMETALAACVRVDDSIYAYIVALDGNITAETADLAKEAQEALTAAVKFYKNATKNADYFKTYEYEISEDESVVLYSTLDKLLKVQTGSKGTEGTLAWLTNKAEELVQKIDDAAKALDVDDLEDAYDLYRDFVRDAKKISEKNVALVTNADLLVEALASAENLTAAKEALTKKAWEMQSLLKDTHGQYKAIFFDYIELAKTKAQAIFMFETKNAKKDVVKAETIKIYDAIDAQLAELAEEYELSDAALALVVDLKYGENFYAKYESDKALVKAFAAEYEELAAGVFADIDTLAAAKLTVDSAASLVEAYKANAKAINDWAKDLKDAYAKMYNALDKAGKAAVSYDVTSYNTLVEKNFNEMAIASELGAWTEVKEDGEVVDYKYDTYNGGLDEKGYYNALYAFKPADNEALGQFLATTFVAADKLAKTINKKIADFNVDMANSVLDIIVVIGGYYPTIDKAVSEDGKLLLYPIDAKDADDYVDETIAEFVATYQKDEYDLTSLLDLEAYEAKVAAVAASVEESEAALKALMDAYNALLVGEEKDQVIVTMDNADEIIKLETLLVAAKAVVNASVKKLVVADTKDGLEVYELKDVVAEYIAVNADGEPTMTSKEFYDKYLDSVDFTSTVIKDGEVVEDTGVITRLVYQAKALKADAAVVESIYTVMKQLNDATAGQVFAYSTLKDANTLLTKMYASTASLALEGFWYGIGSLTTATKTDKDGKTLYQTTATAVRFNNDTGRFYMGSKAGEWDADKNTSIRLAIDAVRSQWVYKLTVTDNADENVKAFNEQIHNTLVNSKIEDGKLVSLGLKDANRADLGKLFGNQNQFIPGYLLPMVATNLEAKFLINNMGETTEAITAAKAGWGDTSSNYGFEYNKALVANLLRGKAALDTTEFATLGNAVNYSALTKAIRNINDARETGAKIDFSISFGHADASWLSPVYDITVKNYAAGGFVALDFTVDTSKIEGYDEMNDAEKALAEKVAYYASYGADVSDLEVITIWEAPAVELQ